MHLKPSRGNNSESMTELSFLYATHRHDLFYITVKYDYIPKGIHRADTKLHLKPLRGNNSESMKARAVILVWPYRHDLFYITEKYHDYIPNDF